MLFRGALGVVLAGATTVIAHGYVDKWTIGGQNYAGYNPTIAPWQADQGTISWPAWNTDTGPVYSRNVGSPDVICSINATNSNKYPTPIAAGSTFRLHWTAWADSHKGPVLTYLAACNGDCATVDKRQLQWFKIAERGQVSYGAGGGVAGVWAADQLRLAGGDWDVTIPSTLKAGNYVLRHEIIALHGAYNLGEAQLYPQCTNIQITGGGNATPSGVVGTSLYRTDDPGLRYDIYSDQNRPVYRIPGPPLFTHYSDNQSRIHFHT
ncbi:glycoside hydrolase [Chaetomium sp. MPI-CAGE-AT-0009]|nr:glycoside hydrolase [Chaetomium sp. MPI-CAGE-AT-0009]